MTKIKRDDGYAIVEFAITIPILVSIFAIGIWVIGLSIKKFEMQSYANNMVRALSRGEQLSQDFIQSAPKDTKITVVNDQERIRIETSYVARLPILKKEVEVTAVAQGLSEVYETE